VSQSPFLDNSFKLMLERVQPLKPLCHDIEVANYALPDCYSSATVCFFSIKFSPFSSTSIVALIIGKINNLVLKDDIVLFYLIACETSVIRDMEGGRAYTIS
jgi:hypothetical protein